MTDANVPSLSDIEFVPYIDTAGLLPSQWAGQVGVYAVFSPTKELQYIGYSRDVSLSLKQLLIRQPQSCGWVKVHIIARPSRSILENIRSAWIDAQGMTPAGNAGDREQWEQPVAILAYMTPAERQAHDDPQLDELSRLKILKQAGRRIGDDILAQLEQQGLKESLRFNPKLKESGILELK